MAHRKLPGARPGIRSSSLLVALMPDAPLRLEEGLLERFADEFFRLAHRYGGEPLVVSRSGVLAGVRGPRGLADAIRAAAGRRWAPYGPCWKPLRGAGPTPCSSSAGWRAPDLGDEGARRLLQRIAGEAIAATTDTEPPADIRFRGVVHLTAAGGAEECGRG
ncbi:MAG: hypothetical protein LM590_05065 [Thermofilum sp.]|nr:hypothetical protein [Thermofilum sp.]